MNEYSRIDLRYSYQEADKIITTFFDDFPADIAINLMEFIPSGYAIMPRLNRHWNQISKRIGKAENPFPVVVKLILDWLGPKEFSIVSRLNKNWKRSCCLTFVYVSNSSFAARMFALKCFNNSVQLTNLRTINSKYSYIQNIQYENQYGYLMESFYRNWQTRYSFHCGQNKLQLINHNGQDSLLGVDEQYIFFSKSNNILVFDNTTGKCIRKIKILKRNKTSNSLFQVFRLSVNRLIGITYAGYIDQYDLNGKIPPINLHYQERVINPGYFDTAPGYGQIVDETLFLPCETAEASYTERNLVIDAYHLGKHHWTFYKEPHVDGYRNNLQGIRSNKTHLLVFLRRSIHCYSSIQNENPIWEINLNINFDLRQTQIASNGKYMIISENPGIARYLYNLENGSAKSIQNNNAGTRIAFWNNHLIVGTFKVPNENVQVFSLWDSITGKLLSTTNKTEKDISEEDYYSFIALPGNCGIVFGIGKKHNIAPNCIKKHLSCCIPFFDNYQHHFKLLKT